jgi:phosphate uptake regulator
MYECEVSNILSLTFIYIILFFVDMEFRKLQVTGGNSYIVSLPKEWIKDMGLKPKDPIAVIIQPDSSILIVPKKEYKESQKTEGYIDALKEKDKDTILRKFISYYLAGYDVIKIDTGKSEPSLRAAIRDIVRRKLIGIEIVEESSTGLLAQCISTYSDLPLKKATERMSIIASGMFEDAIDALKTGNKDLGNEILERDDEVDRFYYLIVRQLNMAIRNRYIIQEIGLSSPRDLLGYRLAAKSIERVGDHATLIALQAEEVSDIGKEVLSKIQDISRISRAVFETSVNSLLRLDTKMAEEAISRTKEVVRMEQRVSGEILAPKMYGNEASFLKLILESVKRVAEYGADISEITIDMTVKEP